MQARRRPTDHLPAALPSPLACAAPPSPQVIDVEGGWLQNVITFPPEGAFIVDSGIQVEGPQRTAFKFRAATLQLPGRALRLPPFGQGW
jgi:hypothetical protein